MIAVKSEIRKIRITAFSRCREENPVSNGRVLLHLFDDEVELGLSFVWRHLVVHVGQVEAARFQVADDGILGHDDFHAPLFDDAVPDVLDAPAPFFGGIGIFSFVDELAQRRIDFVGEEEFQAVGQEEEVVVGCKEDVAVAEFFHAQGLAGLHEDGLDHHVGAALLIDFPDLGRVGDGQAHVDVVVAVDVVEVGKGVFEDDDVAVRFVVDFVHGEIIGQ